MENLTVTASTFHEYGLKSEILKAIDGLGFTTPTPIQKKAFTHLMASRQDLIAVAQTGTGKTAAFSIPLLHQVDTESKKNQVIILSPTRELCLQICKDIESYSKHIRNLNTIAVYGGTPIDGQIRQLRKGCQVVVGTPGRTLDLIKRKRLDLSNIEWVVLDEADEMLSMGFKEDLNAILAAVPEERQTLLFSATMPREIISLSRKYMTDAVQISVNTNSKTTDNVTHVYYVAQARDRYLALKRITDINPNIYAIVFCRTRRETKEIAEFLARDGYNTDALHGDLSQAQRDYVMNRFRKKQIQLLVATDVAARGIDVNDLTHVINYNLPDETEVYVHRSGRTGRAGNKGISASIINSREMGRIRMIERKIGKKMEQQMIPTGKDVCEKQLLQLIDKVEKIDVNEQIDEFLPAIYAKLELMNREDLIKHFVSLEFNRFLDYYKDARDINTSSRSSSDRDRPARRNGRRSDRNERGRSNDRRDRGDRRNGNYARFFINVGSRDKLNPRDLLGLINQYTPDNNIQVGKIEILKSFSFFEVSDDHKSTLPRAFSRATFNGIKLSVEPASAPKKKRRRFNPAG